MQMHSFKVRFILYDASTGAAVSETSLLLDENATYEDIIQMLIQRQFLRSLNSQFRYDLVLKIVYLRILLFGPDGYRLPDPPTRAILREGQTLASTNLLKHLRPRIEHQETDGVAKIKLDHYLDCAISMEIQASSPPKEKPSSAPSLDEIINAFLTSPTVNIINLTASVVTITTALILIKKHWSKKHSADSTSPQKQPSQPSESEIVAIRLLMTDGTQHRFEEWLTDPDRLKHYIDVFNQPSGSVKPLQAIFLLKKGRPIVIDVSEGAQNNLQLNELLSYLNSDDAEK